MTGRTPAPSRRIPDPADPTDPTDLSGPNPTACFLAAAPHKDLNHAAPKEAEN